MTLKAIIPDDLHEVTLAQAERMEERAARGSWEDFDRVMARVPDVPPVLGDER